MWQTVKIFSAYRITPSGLIYGRCKRPLKPNKRGEVTLYKDGRKYCRQVGRLVLETYMDPCPRGYHLRHVDGDLTDNRLGNLCWTRK